MFFSLCILDWSRTSLEAIWCSLLMLAVKDQRCFPNWTHLANLFRVVADLCRKKCICISKQPPPYKPAQVQVFSFSGQNLKVGTACSLAVLFLTCISPAHLEPPDVCWAAYSRSSNFIQLVWCFFFLFFHDNASKNVLNMEKL